MGDCPSFSAKVKQELVSSIPRARHCQIAELAIMTVMLGHVVYEREEPVFLLDKEQDFVLKKYFTLLEKTSSICTINTRIQGEELKELQSLLKLKIDETHKRENWEIDLCIAQQTCCKQAMLRGAFLAAGTMSDPSKGYHFEIVCRSYRLAEQLAKIMEALGIQPRITQRKERVILYLKGAETIVAVLGLMGAPVSFMEMENIRIVHQMRGDVNRQVNCETANISKTVSAAVKQLEDIEYIERVCGLDQLPPGLYDIAILRRAHPQVSIQELGDLLEPPLGKSGVNHRMRRINRFASELKQERN